MWLYLLLQASQPLTWDEFPVPDAPPLRYAVLADSGPNEPRPWLLVLEDPHRRAPSAVAEGALDPLRGQGWGIVVLELEAEEPSPAPGPLERFLDALETEPSPSFEPRPHLVGLGSQGARALDLAGKLSSRFRSVSAALHSPPALDPLGLERLAELPVRLEGPAGSQAAPELAARLEKRGASWVTLATAGDRTTGPRDLTAWLAAVRRREGERGQAVRAVQAVLDRLHRAAATADAATYFDLFTPGAVFIGTDASERWTLDAFRAFAAPYFEGESAWTYRPMERHVALSPDGRVAWFDEQLAHARYGTTRGSGTLVRTHGRWRIAHYVLSFPVPNEVAEDVVEVIRGER